MTLLLLQADKPITDALIIRGCRLDYRILSHAAVISFQIWQLLGGESAARIQFFQRRRLLENGGLLRARPLHLRQWVLSHLVDGLPRELRHRCVLLTAGICLAVEASLRSRGIFRRAAVQMVPIFGGRLRRRCPHEGGALSRGHFPRSLVGNDTSSDPMLAADAVFDVVL